MKAYYPAMKFIQPDPATYLTEPIAYYVTTMVELVALDSNCAAINIHVNDNDSGTTVAVPLTVEYNPLLEKVPVFGTKCDCESACKVLNRTTKEKIALTIQVLNQI